MPRFNTFDEVVSWYERTPVLKSKIHMASQDVRPIGDRRRKWERIIKIHDNMYILTDGNYDRTLFGSYTPDKLEITKTMGPILWERRDDGDYITVTNHLQGNAACTRYHFLHDYLPRGVNFHHEHGSWELGVHTPTGYTKYPLPKSNARTHYDPATHECVIDGVVRSLTFKALGSDEFVRAGAPVDVRTKRINKEKKKQWKPAIKRVLEDVYLYHGMLDISWNAMNRYSQQVGVALYMLGNKRDTSEQTTRFFAEVLSNPEHEHYIAVLAAVIHATRFEHVDHEQSWLRITEVQAKANFNRLMNNILDLYEYESI